jgi:hypothetical protein
MLKYRTRDEIKQEDGSENIKSEGSIDGKDSNIEFIRPDERNLIEKLKFSSNKPNKHRRNIPIVDINPLRLPKTTKHKNFNYEAIWKLNLDNFDNVGDFPGIIPRDFLNLKDNFNIQNGNNTTKFEPSHVQTNMATIEENELAVSCRDNFLNKPNEFQSNRHNEFGSNRIEYGSNGTIIKTLIANVFGNISRNIETEPRHISEYNTIKNDNISISSFDESISDRKVHTDSYQERKENDLASFRSSYRSIMSKRSKK